MQPARCSPTEKAQPRPGAVVDLYGMVAVTRVSDRGSGTDLFCGSTVPGANGRTFGGQLVGQAVSAASATTDMGSHRVAHSLHAYFVRAGDATRPVMYTVDRVRDGRSFSVRSVEGQQDGKLLFTATMSFHEPQPGLSHQMDLVGTYPDPESLATDDRFLNIQPGSGGSRHRSAVELRRIPEVLDPGAAGRRAGQAIWFRSAVPRGFADEAVDRAALAMSTDFTILEGVVYGHGLTFRTPGLTVASLDHSVWWHAPASLDDWLLYVQESPWAGGERGLVTGHVYDREGVLVASVTQEGLIRLDKSGNQ